MPYRLLVLADSGVGCGELPARNMLFRMALQDPDWQFCITLSNDIFELPEDWGLRLVEHLQELPADVGALNAYGYINTFPGEDWAQSIIDAEGNNTGLVQVFDAPYKSEMIEAVRHAPPNPELSTACCIIKREVLEKVGLFDEGFGRGGGMEHWDYVIRMYKAGYQNLLTYRANFKADIKNGNNFAPNDTATYYRKKWGTQFDGIPVKEFIKRAKELK